MRIQTVYNVITTGKVKESAEFYRDNFCLEIVADLGWYVQLKDTASGAELAFMEPGHPSQPKEYQREFCGGGIILTFQVEDARESYNHFKNKGVPIFFDLKQEEWGQLHFGVYDPNNITVDIVQYME